jgi:AcrR family transcriptional regulator
MQKPTAETTLRQLLPRREPKQQRSRILFDKIISTAVKLFERHGFAYVTTNRIAEEANISIGSLYQYFKNCESIALAAYEQACANAALTMKRMTLESLSLPLEASIAKHIERVFDIYEKDHYALLQLINELPELRRASQPLSISNLMNHASQVFLEQYFTDVNRLTIARKCYILDKSVMGIISQYLEDRPDFLSRSEAIAETIELVQLYVNTLSRHSVRRQTRRVRARQSDNSA